jgi:hypothetical protein
LPTNFLDRQARSSRTTMQTDLLVAKSYGIEPWQNLSKAEQVRLVTHELSVLAGYENDGEYFISESMQEILKMHSPGFKLISISAETIIENKDGSVTLIYPYLMHQSSKYYLGEVPDLYPGKGQQSDPKGICTYLNLPNTHAYVLTSEDYRNEHRLAVINNLGHLVGLWYSANHYHIRVRSITCE